MVLILLFSCTDVQKTVFVKKKKIIKNDTIEIAFGSSPHHRCNIDILIANYREYDGNEKINTKTVYGDTTEFIYYYKYYMSYIDTLTIFKPDSLVLRTHLKFVSKKNINFKGKSLIVKKYIQDKGLIFANVYINDSLGIILRRNLSHCMGENTIMYNTGEFLELHDAIINDTVFFEWKLPD